MPLAVITPRRSLRTRRRFGVLVGSSVQSEQRGHVRRRSADLIFRLDAPQPDHARHYDQSITQNLILSPHFSFLINWSEHSEARMFREFSQLSARSFELRTKIAPTTQKIAKQKGALAPRLAPIAKIHQHFRLHDSAANSGVSTLTSKSTSFLNAPRTEAGVITARLTQPALRSKGSKLRAYREAVRVRKVFQEASSGSISAGPVFNPIPEGTDVAVRRVAVSLVQSQVAQHAVRRVTRSDLFTTSTVRRQDMTISAAGYRVSRPELALQQIPQSPATAHVSAAPVNRPVSSVVRRFRTPDVPITTPPIVTPAHQPAAQEQSAMDLNRLESDLWTRFEKRIRVEQQRRGRV